MKNALWAAAFGLGLGCAAASAQNAPPREWDGLVRVQSERFDLAYLAPGADFNGYTKVMIDPTEAAFRRNWQRDHNDDVRDLSTRITDDEARDILEAVQTGFQEIFVQAYTEAGYQVVTTPGPDVVRLRTGIANLVVTAPDQRSGRSANFSRDAGEATFVLEVRDSMSGALLARGIDSSVADDEARAVWRTRASNYSDFRRMFRVWADMSVQAFAAIRAAAPVAAPAGG